MEHQNKEAQKIDCRCLSKDYSYTCDFCLGKANGFAVGILQFNAMTVDYTKLMLGLGPDNCLDKFAREGGIRAGSELYVSGFNMGLIEALNRKPEDKASKGEKNDKYIVNPGAFGETYHIVCALLSVNGDTNKTHRASITYASLPQMVFVSSILCQEKLVFNLEERNAHIKKLKALEQMAKMEAKKELKSKETEEKLAKEKFKKAREKLEQEVFRSDVGTTTEFINEKFKDKRLSESREVALKFRQYFIKPLTDNIPKIDNVFSQYVEKEYKMKNKLSSKAIIAVRRVKDSDRNMTPEILSETIRILYMSGTIEEVILIGDKINDGEIAENVIKIKRVTGKQVIIHDLTEYHENQRFKSLVGLHYIAGQVCFHHVLRKFYSARFLIGMMSGALDGSAFTGLPTIFLTTESLGSRGYVNNFV